MTYDLGWIRAQGYLSESYVKQFWKHYIEFWEQDIC